MVSSSSRFKAFVVVIALATFSGGFVALSRANASDAAPSPAVRTAARGIRGMPRHGLRVVVSAPNAGSPRVIVTGPHGFERLIHRTTRFAHAKPGRYRVVAKPLVSRQGVAYPSQHRTTVRLRRHHGALAVISFPTFVSSDARVVARRGVADVSQIPGGGRIVTLRGRARYRVGDVLVSGASSTAPDGLLARIVRVRGHGGQRRYRVTRAALDRVIPQASIDQTVAVPLDAAGRALGKANGRVQISCSSGATFTVDREIHGSITLHLTGSWNRSNWNSSSLRLTAVADAGASLAATVSGQAACGTGEQTLATVHLPDVEFSIGPVPVVINPTITFTGAANAAVTASASATIGADLQTSAWIQSSIAGQVAAGYDPPSASFTKNVSIPQGVTGMITASLSARLTANFYGVAGPFVRVNFLPSVQAQTNGEPWLRGDGRVTVDAGLVLNKCVGVWTVRMCADFNASRNGIIDSTWNIFALSSTPTAPPTTTPSTAPPTTPPPPPATTTYAETTGSVAHTWTNYTNAGGTAGQTIASNQTVQIACRLTGFKVADGNTWWYRIASSPWNNQFYVSADAFYNEPGVTTGPLAGTPFVDTSVPVC